jgi:hypothetical protein
VTEVEGSNGGFFGKAAVLVVEIVWYISCSFEALVAPAGDERLDKLQGGRRLTNVQRRR